MIAFAAKPNGAEIARWRGMGTIECHKGSNTAVHAPVSFVLSESNAEAEERPRLISADPYGAGWMARGRALAWDVERALLVNAVLYRRHVLGVEPEACLKTETPQLAILICSPTAEQQELCVTPLVHTLAARALDCAVEIHFSGPAIRLLVEGVAAGLYPTAAREKSILAFLREASAAGVRLLACSMAQAAWVGAGEKLIAECSGHAGATLFVARTLDPDWHTLVF